MISAIFLVLLGLLSASDLVATRFPEIWEKLKAPMAHRKFLGVVGMGYGVWRICSAILFLDDLTLRWTIALTVAIGLVANGFLLGRELVSGWVKGTTATETAKAYDRLLPWQTSIGIVSIAAGLTAMIISVFR